MSENIEENFERLLLSAFGNNIELRARAESAVKKISYSILSDFFRFDEQYHLTPEAKRIIKVALFAIEEFPKKILYDKIEIISMVSHEGQINEVVIKMESNKIYLVERGSYKDELGIWHNYEALIYPCSPNEEYAPIRRWIDREKGYYNPDFFEALEIWSETFYNNANSPYGKCYASIV